MPTLDTDAAPPVDRGQHDRRRSEIPETRVVWLITQRQLTERSTLPSSAWGRRARRTHRLGASHGKQIRPAAAAASDGRRPGRGTGRGTGGREIPVQSALWMRSAVSSVQVMLSVRESRPLVMRRWPVFDWRLRPGSGHVLARRDVASRRWVMSHTTCVSPVSGVPARLAD